MISQATMTKRITGTGVLTDKTPDLFQRHSVASRFRGYVSFGSDEASALLEVADTPALKAKGLMGRKSMPECCGMIFTDLSGGAFWMKGCKIPLDIVFISDNGVVTRQYTMAVDGGVKRYSYGDEHTAIELPAGFCDSHGIGIGTTCKWRIW